MFCRRISAIQFLSQPGIFLLVASLGRTCCSAAEDFTGTLKSVHGQVSINRASQAVVASPGIRLLIKDIIRTASDGSAGIMLHDGTRLSLGPNSALTVEDFVFEPGAGKMDLLIRVFQGVVAYASGKIAHLSPQSVRIETPVGTIGLRGTEFAISLDSASVAPQ